METIRLAFGRGLSRSTGSTVAEPATMDEIFNAHTAPGRLAMRLGLERALRVEAARAILDIRPLRRGAAGSVALVYHVKNNGRLAIGRIAGDGRITVERSHPLFDFDPAATEPPVVVSSDSYDAIYYAHAERTYGRRQPTKRFQVDTTTVPPVDLVTDFGEGDVPLRFYGVEPYLEYLLAWGYGDPLDDDAPNQLRVSIAGELQKFHPENYIPIGQPDDPIITVKRIPDGAIVFKRFESYRFVGHTRESFGSISADALYGCIGPRLAITVGGLLYFWSAEGPRRTSGGPSVDLGFELSLRRPAPWPDAWSADQGFATYLPERREVLFVFGQHAYAFDVDGEQWTYREWQAGALGCAGILEVDLAADDDTGGAFAPVIESAACVPEIEELYPIVASAACRTTPVGLASIVPPWQIADRGSAGGPRLGDLVPELFSAPPTEGINEANRGLVYQFTPVPLDSGVHHASWSYGAAPKPSDIQAAEFELIARVRDYNLAGALVQTSVMRPLAIQRGDVLVPVARFASGALGGNPVNPAAYNSAWPFAPVIGSVGTGTNGAGTASIEVHLFPRAGHDWVHSGAAGAGVGAGGAVRAILHDSVIVGPGETRGLEQSAFSAVASVVFAVGVVLQVDVQNQPGTVVVEIENLDAAYVGALNAWERTFPDLAIGRHRLAAEMDQLTFSFTTYPDGPPRINPGPGAAPDPRWFPSVRVTARLVTDGVERVMLDETLTYARIVRTNRPVDA